jgi:hypothetical protein
MERERMLLADYKGSKWRKERMLKFLALSKATADTSILDVGGDVSTWDGTGLEAHVTILNLHMPLDRPAPYRWFEGDARDLSAFGDKSFDIVFSNSVIEHVGSLEDQRRMAAEIVRVGRGFWVQTPNRHFPLEPHYVFPFVQYGSYPVRAAVAKHWPLSYPQRQKALDPVGELTEIRLMEEKEVRALFPSAEIYREPMLGLTKSLVAYQF